MSPVAMESDAHVGHPALPLRRRRPRWVVGWVGCWQIVAWALAYGLHRLRGDAQVTRILASMQNVDAGDRRAASPRRRAHIVAMVAVMVSSARAGASCQQAGVVGARLAQAFPQSLRQEACAGVRGGAAPELPTMIADAVRLIAEISSGILGHAWSPAMTSAASRRINISDASLLQLVGVLMFLQPQAGVGR